MESTFNLIDFIRNTNKEIYWQRCYWKHKIATYPKTLKKLMKTKLKPLKTNKDQSLSTLQEMVKFKP